MFVQLLATSIDFVIVHRTTGRGALFFSPSRYSFDEESRAGIIDGAFAGIAAFVQQFFRTKRSRIEMFDHRLVYRFVGEVCRRGVEEEMIESVNLNMVPDRRYVSEILLHSSALYV